jgi:HSP20 family protein
MVRHEKETKMALVRWEPSGGLSSLRRELDRLFEEFEGFFEGGITPRRERAFEPAVEVSDTKDALIVKAQVPGVSKDDLHVDISDHTLTLKGEMKADTEEKEKHYYRREWRYGAFSRTIPLPMEVQGEQAKAQMKDGVIEITIPKSERAKVKEIPVQVS